MKQRQKKNEVPIGFDGGDTLSEMLLFRISNLVLLFAITGSCVYFSVTYGIPYEAEAAQSFQKSLDHYGWLVFVLYALQYLALLALPQSLFNFLGFLIYNPFPSNPKLKQSPPLLRHIRFRVVTRGDYPDLVKRNVDKNINVCLSCGIQNFMFEVVTDKTIGLVSTPLKFEITVPPEYQTKTGALYKSRALQYALVRPEKSPGDEVRKLCDEDWIVHLDEETILTERSVNGIVNFILEGKHQFGQGLITYTSIEIPNYFLTLCDTVRVAEDMGKIQFQLRALHMPILGWKGSFVVSQLGAEKSVSFDNGPDGSIAEDTYFGLIAASKGYSFDFIQGEMCEKSPFTIMDFLRQRKRWLQGFLLVAHSSKIPLRYRIGLMTSVYSWITLPLTTVSGLLKPVFPIALPLYIEACVAFIGGMWMYLYVYGTIRSFSVHRYGVIRCVLFLLAGVLITPFKIIVESIAVIWGLVTPKHNFYIVTKDLPSSTEVI